MRITLNLSVTCIKSDAHTLTWYDLLNLQSIEYNIFESFEKNMTDTIIMQVLFYCYYNIAKTFIQKGYIYNNINNMYILITSE